MLSQHERIVAGIDCGTNSIRLKISRIHGDGCIEDIVSRVLRVIRLGEKVDATHEFSPQALERLTCAVDEFSHILADYDVTTLRFVATSASRDVKNRDVFYDIITQHLHVQPEVISGEEEAYLSFLSATHYLDKTQFPSPYTVFDLGGGSTELVLGEVTSSAHSNNAQSSQEQYNIRKSHSMDIGSVRMTERFLTSDPPTIEEVEAATHVIDPIIEKTIEETGAYKARTLVGVSGTVTTMAALTCGMKEYDHAKLQGLELPIDAIISTSHTFIFMPRAQRSTYKTIHPARVDVIGGGALILSRLLLAMREQSRHYARENGCNALENCLISDHGLLDGIVIDLAHRSI